MIKFGGRLCKKLMTVLYRHAPNLLLCLQPLIIHRTLQYITSKAFTVKSLGHINVGVLAATIHHENDFAERNYISTKRTLISVATVLFLDTDMCSSSTLSKLAAA